MLFNELYFITEFKLIFTEAKIMGIAEVTLNTDTQITDETIATLKQLVRESGEKPLTRQWHAETSLDSVRHWSWGLGDDNPLWCEPDYGAKTSHGSSLTPPSFYYSCNQGPNGIRSTPSRGEGLPGLHAIWAWDRWEWPAPVPRNTPVNTTKQMVEANVRPSKFGGDRCVELVTRYNFRDDAQKLLASYDVAYMHFGRDMAARKGNKGDSVKRQIWSDEALAKLTADVYEEDHIRRGREGPVWDEGRYRGRDRHRREGPAECHRDNRLYQRLGRPFSYGLRDRAPLHTRPSPRQCARSRDAHSRFPTAGSLGCGLGTGMWLSRLPTTTAASVSVG